ncbi:MAG: PAS domain S-box protein [Candidatus Marinimicrobia bacterium]|nr:PAS domain S-box protein [Candidatus Neomarinimicrobiota bacterium]
MIVLIVKVLLALILGSLFVFTLALGERYRFRVQRGWYLIVLAFAFMWLESIMRVINGMIPVLSTPFFQVSIGQNLGHVGAVLLAIGLFLWGPKIAAFRDQYLLKIKTSEERFRMLAEKATDMLVEHDMKGNFLYATPGSKQMVGYEPEELIGKSIYDFIDTDQLEMVQKEHAKILEQNEPVTSTYKFRHKDGHYIWLESVTRLYKPMEKEKEDRILAMSRDVSERIRYDDELNNLNQDLKLQQERFRMLYTLAVSEHLELEGKLDLTLAVSAKTLNMGLGIISRIKGDEYTVLHFTPESAPLEKGQIFVLGQTYCSITLQNKGLVAIDQMSTSPHAGHPCWEALNLESYIGVPIYVQGEIYGTLNFSQPAVREVEFTEGDKDFIRLVGQWVSRVLEQDFAQQKLQQSEEKFRGLVQSAVVGVITMDATGIIDSFNESAERIFGYYSSEVVGKNVNMLMKPPEADEHDGYLKKYLSGGAGPVVGRSVTVTAKRKDGSPVILDLGVNEVVTDETHFFTGTFRDITQEKEALDSLANAHLQLKSVFDSATQVAIIATDLEGLITIFNPGAELMLGYTAEEVLGKPTSIFHIDAEVEAWSKDLSKQLGRDIDGFETFVALAKLGGQAEHEWTYVRKDGSHLTVNSAVTALRDTSDSITGFLGIILDITSRKQAESALILAKTMAEEANKTKSDFLANMSHELRTPLNSVIGFSSIMLSTLAKKLDEKNITYLERIHANGKHLLMLINDVLDLSKIEAGKMELEIVEINLGDQIREILDQLESLVKDKPVDLIAIIPDGLKSNFIDPAKIKQVLMNLISNSIKFTKEGSITLEVIKNKKTHKVSEIKVTDTGIGIPSDRLEKIFDEFSQVDSSTQRKYGGTGLGLSISRRMCQLMSCSLVVESEVGVGSTFTIRLPEQDLTVDGKQTVIQDTEGRRADKSRTTKPQDDLEGYRILIVDDDRDSQVLLNHYLTNTGCIIDTASSAKEAFKKIREHRPDLITLDIQMPNISGDTFLKALKSDVKFQDIPVVVVSVIARESKERLAGAVDFIQKPVHRQQLLWAIKRNLRTEEKRILIVEDDPDMRLTLSNYIGGVGVDIRSADNGESALEIIKTSIPNLILLDLMMPGMDGHEFLKILKKDMQYQAIPVIVVTGKDLSSEEDLYLKTEQIIVVTKGEKLEQEIKHQVNKIFLG